MIILKPTLIIVAENVKEEKSGGNDETAISEPIYPYLPTLIFCHFDCNKMLSLHVHLLESIMFRSIMLEIYSLFFFSTSL